MQGEPRQARLGLRRRPAGASVPGRIDALQCDAEVEGRAGPLTLIDRSLAPQVGEGEVRRPVTAEMTSSQLPLPSGGRGSQASASPADVQRTRAASCLTWAPVTGLIRNPPNSVAVSSAAACAHSCPRAVEPACRAQCAATTAAAAACTPG